MNDDDSNNSVKSYEDYFSDLTYYKKQIYTNQNLYNKTWVDEYSYTTGTTGSTGSSFGSTGNTTTTTGTLNINSSNGYYGINTNGIDFSNLHNTFIKSPFSKSSFLDSLSEGKSVVNAITAILESLTDDGVVDAIEFVDKIGCLTDDVYWQIAHKKHSIYIMYTRFHDLENCKAFFTNSKNHNLIKFTRKDILEDAEFKRHINTMKLKGMF